MKKNNFFNKLVNSNFTEIDIYNKMNSKKIKKKKKEEEKKEIKEVFCPLEKLIEDEKKYYNSMIEILKNKKISVESPDYQPFIIKDDKFHNKSFLYRLYNSYDEYIRKFELDNDKLIYKGDENLLPKTQDEKEREIYILQKYALAIKKNLPGDILFPENQIAFLYNFFCFIMNDNGNDVLKKMGAIEDEKILSVFKDMIFNHFKILSKDTVEKISNEVSSSIDGTSETKTEIVWFISKKILDFFY